MKTVNVRNPKSGGKVNIQSDAVGSVPVGTILDFAGAGAIPEGFLSADGTTKNIVDYPDLATVLSTTWGGDGVTTFGLPNAQNKFLKGKDSDAVGDSGGSNTNSHTHSVTSNVSVDNHTLITANLPVHSHTINHGHSASSGNQSANHSHSVTGGSVYCADIYGRRQCLTNTLPTGGASYLASAGDTPLQSLGWNGSTKDRKSVV